MGKIPRSNTRMNGVSPDAYSEKQLLEILAGLDRAASPEALCAGHGIGGELARALWARRTRAAEILSNDDTKRSVRLETLLEVVNELAKAPGFDALCKAAAEMAVSRLGFERIGIWFRDEEPGFLRGSFGVDEDGSLRDERRRKVPIRPNDEETLRVLDHQVRFLLQTNTDLRDAHGRTVGQGTSVLAPLWDGEEVIGFIATDNHLRHTEITQEQGHVLAFFAVSVGHLCSIHRATEALRQSEGQLRLIMDQVPALLWTAGPDLRFTSSAGQALARLGQKPGETDGRSLYEYFGTTDPEFAPIRAHLNALEGKTSWFEFEWAGVSFQVYVEPLHDRDGAIIGAIGAALDISNLREAEEERRTLEAQMQHAQKLESLGMMASGVAHDFNNLLVSMLGNAELAQLEVAADSRAHHYLGQIVKAACRAADLCKQMLAYTGKGRLVFDFVDLNAVAREMAELLTMSISKNTELAFHFAEKLPLVKGDATQLRQVLMNLITNASEALEDTPGTVRIRTGTMQCSQQDIESLHVSDGLIPGDYVFIEVADSGCGIDCAVLDRIFDPFYSTKFTGRGLGLAAVLGIVRGHGGGIGVSSAPGKGTAFRILLPPHEAPVPRPERTDDRGRGLASGSVLIIDDETHVRELAEQMLTAAGYRVLAAPDGDTGVALLESDGHEVDIVLLDLAMPGMDGVATFEKLRMVNRTVPVVLCSGYGKELSIARFPDGALAGFLGKPFRMGELVQTVSQVLGA